MWWEHPSAQADVTLSHSALRQSNDASLQPLVIWGLSLAVTAVLMYGLAEKSFGKRWEEEGEGVCCLVACTSCQTERWWCKYLSIRNGGEGMI